MDVRYIVNGFIKGDVSDVSAVSKELEYIFSLARNSGLNDLIKALLRPHYKVYDLVDASKLNERLCVTQVRHDGDNITYTLRNNGFDYVLGVYENLIILSVSGNNLEEQTYEFPIDILTNNQKYYLETLLYKPVEDTKEVNVEFKISELDIGALPASQYDCKVVCNIRYDGCDYISEFNAPKFMLVTHLERIILDNLKAND